MSTKLSRRPADVMARNFNTSVRAVTDRIVATFESATDDELVAGMEWYFEAANHAAIMSARYGVTFEQAAAVISHLSPQLDWAANLSNAYSLLADGKTHAVLGDSVKRAKRAMVDPAPAETFGDDGPKIRSFYWNIVGEHSKYVTVDRHALRVAFGYLDTDLMRAFARVGSYEAITHCYRLAAKRVGVTPAQVQAVTWVVVRGRAN